MALIIHSNWRALGGTVLSDFFDDDRFSSLLSRSTKLPAVNIQENDKSFEVEVAAPGFKKCDFNITVDKGLFIISAEQQAQNERKDGNFVRREFGFSSFSRALNLPANSNEEAIGAKYENGILKLSITKKDHAAFRLRRALEIE